MYIEDHNDNLPPNKAGLVDLSGHQSLPGSWVVGNTQRDTNTTKIKAGVMFPYAHSAGIYHCPADQSSVTGSPSVSRTRSYSLENWLNGAHVGGGYNWKPDDYPWSVVKMNTVINPALVFGFIDEHEASIQSGLFIISQPARITKDAGTTTWWTLPADRHQQGCNLSFLDGRAEHWRWQAPKVFRAGTHGTPPASRLDLEDHKRLQEKVPHDVLRTPEGW
jgi:prepilin-type processing-associated H-X9-DG protein